jgi:transcriptional regulator with XRE-family HTH domain
MPEQILVEFGKKVREERHKQHLSQEQLAEIAGLHRTYIGMIERAERNITLENINKICKALDINLGAMFKDLHDC